MTAETPFPDDNIPHEGMSVKSPVCEALSGCPVRVRSLSLQVARGTSIADVGVICERLFRSQSRISLSYQFCLGDAYNFTLPYSKERKELDRIIDRVLGPAYADRLRSFGSVAKRWPADRRSDKLVWEYYKTHRPGEPGKPDVVIVKKRIRLQPVCVEVVDGVEVEVFAGRGEQFYEVVRVVKCGE